MDEQATTGDIESRLTGPWRKSSASDPVNCVELAPTTYGVAMRDTKDRGRGPILHFTRHEFHAFMAGCKAGDFDSLI